MRNTNVLGHMPPKWTISGWGGGQGGVLPPLCSQNYWFYEKMIIVKLVQNHHITNIWTTLEVHRIKIEKTRERFQKSSWKNRVFSTNIRIFYLPKCFIAFFFKNSVKLSSKLLNLSREILRSEKRVWKHILFQKILNSHLVNRCWLIVD